MEKLMDNFISFFFCLFFLKNSMWWFSAMSSNRNRDEFGPVTRNRSSSANEASKPILVLQRRLTHTGNKPLNFSPSNASNDGKSFSDFFLWIYAFAIYSLYQQKTKSQCYFLYFPLLPIWTYIYIQGIVFTMPPWKQKWQK